MIKYTDQNAVKNQLFTTPFQQELDPTNRWVVMSELIPWDKLATIFMKNMSSKMGRSTIDLRTIMGAMFIQHSLNLTDRKTIEMISENVYMQYFVGLKGFCSKPIFDASLFVEIRKRIGASTFDKLNTDLIQSISESEDKLVKQKLSIEVKK